MSTRNKCSINKCKQIRAPSAKVCLDHKCIKARCNNERYYKGRRFLKQCERHSKASYDRNANYEERLRKGVDYHNMYTPKKCNRTECENDNFIYGDKVRKFCTRHCMERDLTRSKMLTISDVLFTKEEAVKHGYKLHHDDLTYERNPFKPPVKPLRTNRGFKMSSVTLNLEKTEPVSEVSEVEEIVCGFVELEFTDEGSMDEITETEVSEISVTDNETNEIVTTDSEVSEIITTDSEVSDTMATEDDGEHKYSCINCRQIKNYYDFMRYGRTRASCNDCFRVLKSKCRHNKTFKFCHICNAQNFCYHKRVWSTCYYCNRR